MVKDDQTAFEIMLAERAGAVEALLRRILDERPLPGEIARPQRLLAAMRHGVLNGGKRLRPFLVLESAALFSADGDPALRVAAALECIHCYSLIHDDLPAMDDDDLRRGQPTVHKAFDEATAILAGDALLTLAFDIVADAATVLARTGAEADAAATLIANAVDLPGHAAIERLPACELAPDSDLGGRLVTTGVGPLAAAEIAAALDRGLRVAEDFRARGLIAAAALFLQDEIRVSGVLVPPPGAGMNMKEIAHA